MDGVATVRMKCTTCRKVCLHFVSEILHVDGHVYLECFECDVRRVAKLVLVDPKTVENGVDHE